MFRTTTWAARFVFLSLVSCMGVVYGLLSHPLVTYGLGWLRASGCLTPVFVSCATVCVVGRVSVSCGLGSCVFLGLI